MRRFINKFNIWWFSNKSCQRRLGIWNSFVERGWQNARFVPFQTQMVSNNYQRHPKHKVAHLFQSKPHILCTTCRVFKWIILGLFLIFVQVVFKIRHLCNPDYFRFNVNINFEPLLHMDRLYYQVSFDLRHSEIAHIFEFDRQIILLEKVALLTIIKSEGAVSAKLLTTDRIFKIHTGRPKS